MIVHRVLSNAGGSTPGPARKIAIVGMGPRGLAVLERLLIRLHHSAPQGVVIWAIDPIEHGPGRVWRTSQPWWLTTNATASEVTVQSPDSHLAGDGFSAPHTLSGWTKSSGYPGRSVEPVEYPPRRVYGEYLRDVFVHLCATAPPGVEVRPVLGEVTRLERSAGILQLTVGDGPRPLSVDKVVLATGHVAQEPTEEDVIFHGLARDRAGCVYVGPGMAGDMALDQIEAGVTVAVRGLGLTFYDVVRSLTLGRGGGFVREASGQLRYVAGGREPVVVAGSRSGLPFLARPHVSEPPDTAPRPVVLTERRIAQLRARAVAERGSAQLDFARDVEPLVQAEADYAYYACAARLRGGEAAGERFHADFERVVSGAGPIDPASWATLLSRHGLEDMPPLRLGALARPFDGRQFRSPSHFQACLLRLLRADVVDAREGPVGNPRKAAFDVLRRVRPLMPSVVDFGGLLPASHRDFLARFEPLNYLLSAGPPDDHVEQLVALLEAGVVRVVGPGAGFSVDDGAGRYVVESPAVAGSRCRAEAFVDARVPPADIRHTASRLVRTMAADGMLSQYVNVDPTTGERFETGGVAVTRAPFHVVDRWGKPDPSIYAIGVVTDKTRWFTQVGTGRPGQDSPFCRDADAIAADMLADYPVGALSSGGA